MPLASLCSQLDPTTQMVQKTLILWMRMWSREYILAFIANVSCITHLVRKDDGHFFIYVLDITIKAAVSQYLVLSDDIH